MMKKKRNIRRREESTSDGEEDKQIPFLEENYHVQVKHVQKTLQEKIDKKNKKSGAAAVGAADGENGGQNTGAGGPAGASLLSFDHVGDDEDEEVFQIKKSSHSKKVAKKLRERARKEKHRDEVAKLVKRSSTKTEPLTTKLTVKSNDKTDTSRKFSRKSAIILHGVEAEAAALEEEDRKELQGYVIAPGIIPDAATIFAARKRRQLARNMGKGADYIPVDDTQRYSNTSKAGGGAGGEESRLVRDDDFDRSGSEDEGRMSLSVKQATHRQRVQEAMDENVDDGSDQDKDHDEELQRWEREQIKKGTSVPQAQDASSSMAAANVAAAYYYQQQEFPYSQPTSQYATPTTVGGAYGIEQQAPAVHGLSAAPMCEMPTVKLDHVKKKLRDWFESVKNVHRAHDREYDQLQERLGSSADTSVNLKDTQGGVNGQYHFYQEMRGYIKDLMACFAENVPIIGGLEIAMMVLLANRSERLTQRRQTDIRDQSEEFTGMLQRAALSANFDGGAKKEDVTQQRRAAEREARRSRRRRGRESNPSDSVAHIDGMSTDEELRESDQDKFTQEKDRVMAESQRVFEDAVEEYHAISLILSRFERWRSHHSDSYNEAYISLCLAKLLDPLVRLQLLDWNPLQTGCLDLEEMPWYESVLFFGCRDIEAPLDIDDPDIALIPNLVQKVVLPKLSELADNVWDPMSTSQTERLVSLVHRLVEDYPTVNSNSKNMRDLLKSLIGRMRRTLDEDVYMPLFPREMLEKSTIANSFMQRQFWACVKLLGNLLLWHGLVSEEPLIELAIDGLLNRYMLLSLQNSDVNDESIFKCQRIVATFPPQWFKELKGDGTLRQLEPFSRYLEHAADTLKTKSITSSDIDRRIAKLGMKTVTKLLVTIHAVDHALNISQGFSLKDMKEILEKD